MSIISVLISLENFSYLHPEKFQRPINRQSYLAINFLNLFAIFWIHEVSATAKFFLGIRQDFYKIDRYYGIQPTHVTSKLPIFTPVDPYQIHSANFSKRNLATGLTPVSPTICCCLEGMYSYFYEKIRNWNNYLLINGF